MFETISNFHCTKLFITALEYVHLTEKHFRFSFKIGWFGIRAQCNVFTPALLVCVFSIADVEWSIDYSFRC
jgi:hypothetical protein